jgi:D-aminopeptidase
MAERWRALVGPVGTLPPGERDAITDVPGVRVGHAQAASGDRTGVTVVAPPSLPAAAGTATVNGTGELVAKTEIDELGAMETPVYLCGTHALGTVTQAAIAASGRGPESVVIPVVGECDDGEMADSRTVVGGDVEAALAALGTDVAEGSVGAGTGMTLFGFPGGIGTASRRVGPHHVGVLLLCNFGDRRYLALPGTRLGPEPRQPDGSCIAVCATDAPLSALQLRRLALRPLLGLARAGSYGSNYSGEIALAFRAGGEGGGELANSQLDPYFAAAYEAAHEAVYNCLLAARPAPRRDGTMQDEFPTAAVAAAAREANR